MIYMRWTPSELATLNQAELYTEVDEDGWVQRELTLASDGSVAELLIPSRTDPGWFGLARLSFAMLESNITKAEFESLWDAGGIEAGKT
jgi:hypothetical protein